MNTLARDSQTRNGISLYLYRHWLWPLLFESVRFPWLVVHAALSMRHL